MSFTKKIKNEIIDIDSQRTEKIAKLSAMLNISVFIKEDSFEISNENEYLIILIFNLIKFLYNIEINYENNSYNSLRKKIIYKLSVKDNYKFILEDLSIIKNDKRKYAPDEYIASEEKEKYAYLRGAFLICGSINDPKTSRYNLEFVINNEETSKYICSLLNEFELNAKILKRDKNYMVYIKESEKISDFIKIIGATNSLFYYEDIRIYRDLQNMVNRINNCEQANIDKTIKASNEQLVLIEKLKEKVDFDLLEENIKNVCIYREKYPEVSIGELAQIISVETDKPITKSGIYHRIRKIKNMVND